MLFFKVLEPVGYHLAMYIPLYLAESLQKFYIQLYTLKAFSHRFIPLLPHLANLFLVGASERTMAIIDDITVRVLVNDEPAQEYEVESETDAGPNYIAKYIEAVSEARFKIKLEMAPSMLFTSDGLIFELSLDGKRVMKQTCHRREHHAGRRVFSLKGKRVSGPAGTVRLPFLFSEIKRRESTIYLVVGERFTYFFTAEEATSGMADLSENILDGIGTIIVAVRRVTINGRQLRKGFSRTTELGNITEVPENKCKGINLTHSVKYSDLVTL